MPASMKSCGGSLYVFTNAADHASDCLIDSHGFRPPTKSTFSVPDGMTVHFYVHRHAFLLSDREASPNGFYYPKCMDDIVQGTRHTKTGSHAVAPVETLTQGQRCPNYLLSKQAKGHKNMFGGRAAQRYEHVDYSSILQYVESKLSDKDMDVVSVRDRIGRFVYLEDVLKTFKRKGFDYSEIHCSFCRGGVMDGMKDLFGRGKDEYVGGVPG